jgi:RimJ/RimL family protein N-acetyltransferase
VTARTIRFIESASDAQPAEPDTEQLVVDSAWTPGPGDRLDVRPTRPLITAALRAHQPLAEALAAVDDWAARADLVARLEVNGVSHWFRRRIVYWRWLHDRLIWHWLLAGLLAEGPIDRLRLAVTEPELADVARLARRMADWTVETAVSGGTTTAAVVPHPPLRRQLRDRLRAPARRSALAQRHSAMFARVDALGGEGSGVLVLTEPSVHQTVTSGGTDARLDPFLAPVVESLRSGRLDPVILEIGTRTADDRTWASLQAVGGQRTLPGSILGDSFADPRDDVSAAAAAGVVAGRLTGSWLPLEIDGLDFGPLIVDELRAFAATGLAGGLRQEARIERLLARLQPEALLMINEYSRPEWIVAARRRGIPVAAIQHGVIHPLHAGYILPDRPPSLILADRTYVFGPYESRLLTGESVYRPSEVRVSGAPRLDLRAPLAPDGADRQAIRAELGVAAGSRLVVFSSTSSTAVRRTVIAAAFDGVLDGPWPGVHLVVKLHPAEADGAFYEQLVEGIARARGFQPPPVTIVKEFDLFRLLAGADAHLGVYSTVLTDAVVVGTPNLIVTSLAGSDLLGYVPAAVARPVRTAAELVAALDSSLDEGVDQTARLAFLADHFASGAAAPRIAADLLTGFAGRVQLRRAKPGDADLLLGWANDPVTRANSFQTATILPDEHRRWLAARLASPTSALWIGELGGVPIGQVRIEMDEAGIGEVGISVAPGARGQGIGRRLLGAALAEAGRTLPLTELVARIRPGNDASLALFHAVGFSGPAQGEDPGMPIVLTTALQH